ncbi:hypothetical protein [Clostridium sp. AWRP]|uniref:hypothetical protein n=1 Tax=Clostridium sp. AWRP TaxID=2212991 RepID=UPI000FDADCC3|nr:hypothetical protein [Clostridium sp. AWRP]AZV56622.1 hypothetical protein DMR38_08395 [Clostridium sp. AWRP]
MLSINNNYDYINKAITDKDTNDSNEVFNVHDSTFSQLIKEDRKLIKDGKITEDDYGCMMIHAFISRMCVCNGKLVYKSDTD